MSAEFRGLFKDTLIRLQKYCAYQERCHKEVEQKLRELKVDPETANEVIYKLLEDNFLNEERFARAYARGKFKTKKWGRRKIVNELKFRDISEYCINKGMEEISEEDYFETMEALASKKSKTVDWSNSYTARKKIADHMIRKGFESNLVWDLVRDLEAPKD